MLENKFVRFLLIIVVVTIYATLFVKWKNYSKNEGVPAGKIPVAESLLQVQPIDTTYIISEKNPFNEKARSKKSKVPLKPHSKKESTSGKNVNRVKTTPRISFHGSVKSSNIKKYYVKINGHLKELRIGKTIEGIKLMRVEENFAIFSVYNQIQEIPLINL